MDNLISIAEDKTLTKEERISILCRIDTFNHTELGSDSTDSERAEVKEQQKIIDKLIKDLENE
jgi:hypothetical protein